MTMVATCLINSFVIARVNYCNRILARLPKYQLSHIQSVLNVAARIMYGQARFEHIDTTCIGFAYLRESTSSDAYYSYSRCYID